MDVAAYAAEAAVEADHWWFTGRRRLFASLIKELGLPREAQILDVGTSTGTNLRMLRELGFTAVVGVDRSPEAVRFCAEKGLGDVRQGDILALPFEDACFDLVLATDVIEHVDDDIGALQELCRVLRPTGRLLVTVPTFQILWGLQDEVSHHYRRYRMTQILERIQAAGLNAGEHFYFNYLLFLPILAARRGMQFFRLTADSENQINNRLLNWVFSRIFQVDVWSARRIRPKFGVSALVLASRLRPE